MVKDEREGADLGPWMVVMAIIAVLLALYTTYGEVGAHAAGMQTDVYTSRNDDASRLHPDLNDATKNNVPATPMTVHDRTIMNKVNTSLGLDANGRPHAFHKNVNNTLATVSWWTQTGVNDSGQTVNSQNTDAMWLSPLKSGSYVLDAVCVGTGYFTIDMMADGGEVNDGIVQCEPDEVSSTTIEVPVNEPGEHIAVRFIPQGQTRAAAGFRVESVARLGGM
ncbi:hypothetical protein [Bifidobacterium gallicum]|uniref:Uncharacterized protein n=1 Tax=Bifidobacterium gallicum DSM 20093 = LMG 11596 TaxID=561180 RepID=D1NUR2_9BIFI|nr:hypothetical protein [Bifidobacterium gallicum]EFA22563.1 hypothetical protein BIFGAL_03589 [Bifidobacterium gallicum DSM 20093 = LMG 11596]KFI59551.1 hypothetical protein BGLCM_0217 [Bifidobacterium gallicum DSM 20093 = LMG 11596]